MALVTAETMALLDGKLIAVPAALIDGLIPVTLARGVLTNSVVSAAPAVAQAVAGERLLQSAPVPWPLVAMLPSPVPSVKGTSSSWRSSESSEVPLPRPDVHKSSDAPWTLTPAGTDDRSKVSRPRMPPTPKRPTRNSLLAPEFHVRLIASNESGVLGVAIDSLAEGHAGGGIHQHGEIRLHGAEGVAGGGAEHVGAGG